MSSSRLLTDRMVAGIKPPEKGRIEVWDSLLPGFGLRVNAGGSKSWQCVFRINGRFRRETLGRYPAMKLSQARDKARVHFEAAQRGERHVDGNEGTKRKSGALTLADLVDTYLERYARKRQRRPEETERLLARHWLPELGHMAADRVRKRDVLPTLEALAERTPTQANRALAAIRGAYRWAVGVDLVEVDPTIGIKAPAPEQRRDRVLTMPELAAIWEAAGAHGDYGRIVRILMLTGLRKSEVGEARWDEFDLDERLWTIPADRMKGKRSHVVPLTDQVLELLPERRGPIPFLFPARSAAPKPIAGWNKRKAALDSDCHVAGWTLHDLRRAISTHLRGMGVTGDVIGALLAHTPSGVTRRHYELYDLLRERREALELWTSRLTEAAERR